MIGKLGTLIQISVTVFGIFGGPLLGIFLLGVLVRRANARGAVVGLIAGTLCGIVVAFPQYFLRAPVSFLWIGCSAASATIVVGWIASFSSTPPTLAQQELVYRRKISRHCLGDVVSTERSAQLLAEITLLNAFH